MAKGRQLKGRIRSVQNTRKITRTMELVSTSKLKRAQDRVVAARPYADALSRGHRGSGDAGAGGAFPAAAPAGAAQQGRSSPCRGDSADVQPRSGGRVQLQPDQGSAPPDRDPRGRGLRGRAVRGGQEGDRFLQVSRPQAGRGADRHRRQADRRSRRRDRRAAHRARTRPGSSRAWTWSRPASSARSRPRRRRSESFRWSRRAPGRRDGGTVAGLHPRAERGCDPGEAAPARTSGTWSTAGWWRPPRRSMARGAPR